ncbi:hypothetical protein Tco_1091417 [Tanacetum coccineum]|uniref:Uncharacterized protein n=1 Tax=Tanacetum coccineum TaxID=301880 RepID=A0ABQ5I857_9ASTR
MIAIIFVGLRELMGYFGGVCLVIKERMFEKRKDFDFNFMDFKTSVLFFASFSLELYYLIKRRISLASEKGMSLLLCWLDSRTHNQSLLLQYSRDGYVIEGELKEYEDSCEKSSVQIKFKVKDFIQAIKESSCKRRSKLAFENADFEFESRVDTFRDKEIYLAMKNDDEVYNALLVAKDAKRGEESKLLALTELIVKGLEDIHTLELDLEILGGDGNGV